MIKNNTVDLYAMTLTDAHNTLLSEKWKLWDNVHNMIPFLFKKKNTIHMLA